MTKKKWQDGFLMLDALIAIVITTVGLVAIIGMFIQSTKATHCSAEYSMATNLAQQQMELFKNTKSSSFIKDTEISSVPKTITVPLDCKIDTLPLGFEILSSAKQCPENPTDLVEVTVTVTWTEGKNFYKAPFTTFFQKKA